MAIVRPKFAAAEKKRRDVCIIGTGDGAELVIVDAETGKHLARLTNDDGNATFYCDQAVGTHGDYSLGDLQFNERGYCVQFLKPDVAAMEAELGRMKTEVSMMRAERSKALAESDNYQHNAADLQTALQKANAEVARLREENQELRSRGGDDDESRIRWALERLWKFASNCGRSVVVYPDGDVFADNLYKNTEAARVFVERPKK
jgi:hypothetical protein